MKRNTILSASGLLLAGALITLAGCAGSPRTAGPATQPPPSALEAARPVLAGKVVETMNAGGYTYLSLEKEGQKTWAAVPTMEVKVGDEVELLPGSEMGPFPSKTLNRTFDKIIFSAGPVVKPAGQPAAFPAGHPALPAAPVQKDAVAPMQKNPAAPAAKEVMSEKPLYAGKVVETMNSGGYTYICLEKDGKKSWAAIPPTEVKVGDEIELRPGMEMGKFTSSTLKRTFENIIFSVGITPPK